MTTLMARLAMRDGAVQFISSSALYGLSGVIGKTLALLTVPYLSRTLGPEGYGLADLAVSLAAVLGVIVTFAGDMPTAHRWARAEGGAARRSVLGDYVAATAVFSVVATLLLLPASALIASTLWNSPGETMLAALALIVVPLSALQTALVNALRIVRRPRAFAVLTTVNLTSQLGLAVAFVAIGLGPSGVMTGFVVGSAIGLAATGLVAWSEIELRWPNGALLGLVRQGMNFLPAVVMFLLADTVARVVVANGPGVADVGDMAVAIRLSSALLLVTSAFSLTWGPIGLGLHSAEDALFGRALRVFTMVSTLLAITAAAVSPELVLVIAGGQYSAASLIMPGLLVAHAMTGSHFVLATAAGVMGRSESVAWTTTMAAGVQIAALLVMLGPIGVAAVGISAMLGRLTAYILLALRVRPVAAQSWLTIGTFAGVSIPAVLLISGMNANPAETAEVRYAIALSAGIAGALVFARAMIRPAGSSSATR